MDLANAWDAERGGMRAVADRRLVLLRLHVDDDVAARKGRMNGGLHAIGGGVALANCGARRHGDDDVGELAVPRLTHP